MPNWCSNDLTIEGEDVLKVLEFIKDDKINEGYSFDFSKVIPYPEKWKKLDEIAQDFDRKQMALDKKDPEFAEKMKALREEFGLEEGQWRPKDGYNQGGYDWCIENWGVKWNVGEMEEGYVQDNFAQFVFDTPWGPPEPVIRALSEKFPECQFSIEYYEGGMGFCGEFTYKAGEQVSSSHRDNYRGHRGG
jgi:hypothetical protein